MKIGKTAYILAIVSTLAVMNPVNSFADVENGRAAANRGDFKTAMKEWKPLAEDGNSEAQYNLGRLYARGDGVKQDFKIAFRWFELAALQGHPKAQLALALMYERGDGVKKDLHTAELWRSGKALLERRKPLETSQPEIDVAVAPPPPIPAPEENTQIAANDPLPAVAPANVTHAEEAVAPPPLPASPDLNAFAAPLPDMPDNSNPENAKKGEAQGNVSACSYVLPFPASLMCTLLAVEK